MKLCQCLGDPGSGASCTPADPGTGLWLRKPHLAHETPNRGQRDERVLEQITPQHWLVLQRALLALAVALFRQPYWWHDTMWIWLKGRRVEGDGWQTEREEKQVEKERLMIQFVWKNLVKLLLKCRPTPGYCTDMQSKTRSTRGLTNGFLYLSDAKLSQTLQAVCFNSYLFNYVASC